MKALSILVRVRVPSDYLILAIRDANSWDVARAARLVGLVLA